MASHTRTSRIGLPPEPLPMRMLARLGRFSPPPGFLSAPSDSVLWFVAELVAVTAIFLLISGTPLVGQNSAEQVKESFLALQPKAPLERDLAGQEYHSYRVNLAAGQYARIVLEPQRIDLALVLF